MRWMRNGFPELGDNGGKFNEKIIINKKSKNQKNKHRNKKKTNKKTNK